MYGSVELGYKPFGTGITQLIKNNLGVEKRDPAGSEILF